MLCNERSHSREVCPKQLERSPGSPQLEKSSCSDEDPAQTKRKKKRNESLKPIKQAELTHSDRKEISGPCGCFSTAPSMPQSHMQDYFSWGPNTQCSSVQDSLPPHPTFPAPLILPILAQMSPTLAILPQTPPRMGNLCTSLDFCDSLHLYLCTYTIFTDQFR